MPIPLRSVANHTTNPDSPEALCISALLSSGQFNPDRYKVGAEDLACWSSLWTFALGYQQASGTAPPLDLIRVKFPEFVYTDRVDIVWATGALREASFERDLRRRMRSAAQKLGESDLGAAVAELRGIPDHRGTRRRPTSLFDPVMLVESDVAGIVVPYTAFGRVSGGIRPADYIVLQARTNAGKSWILCNYAAHAVKQGYRVRYISVEMTQAKLARRLYRILARGETTLLNALDSTDHGAQEAAIEVIKNRVEGTLDIVDPGYGRVTPGLVRDLMEDIDLVFVDHLNIMYDDSGHRAIEDYRVQGAITNALHEATLSTGIPLFSAAQTNREGDSSITPPKLTNIANSDNIGWDADIVLSLVRRSEHVMLHRTEKMREGPKATWFSRFDPQQGRFEELHPDAAYSVMDADATAAAGQQ